MFSLHQSHVVASAALVGAKEHAVKQAEAGFDIIIAAGTEAGGHYVEVSTMVLVPEVCQAVEKYGVLQLAAGGVVTARRIAARIAMGVAGAWTDTREDEGAPSPMPMPLQSRVAEPALARVNNLEEGGHEGARQLSTYFVGQGVDLVNSIQSARTVMFEFMEDYLKAVERLNETVNE